MQPGRLLLEPEEGGASVVRLSGEHDLHTMPEIRSSFEAVIREGRGLVVDLSPTTFMDSSVLGTIVEAQQEAEKAGLGFAILLEGGSGAVRKLLEMTGVPGSLPVLASRTAAVELARGRGSAAQ